MTIEEAMTMQGDLPMSKQHSVYIPVLIGLVALVGLLAFQCVELLGAHSALVAQREGQNTAIDSSEKMRQQLNTVAAKTAALAQKGDPDAKALVDAYAKRGLQFVPPKAPAGGAPAPKS